MNTHIISICIVTQNREKFLNTCLFSLLSQKQELIKEVLIIDNASSDNTKAVVNSFKKKLPIRYIYERRKGIAYARNRALEEAKGKLLAFIDDDCEASPNWVEALIKTHDDHPDAAAIQGRAVFSPKQSTYAKFFALGYDFWVWRSRSGNNITICDTANLILHRKKIRSLGVTFDTTFVRGSDVDLAKQLLAKNQEIVYAENAIVFVSVRPTILTLYRQRYQIGKASKQLENKWGIPEKLSEKINVEYKKRFQHFYNRLSLREKLLFRLYKPLYQLGRTRIKTKIEENPVVRNPKYFVKKRSSITVAIITRNRKESLKRCLESIAKQSILPLEVLIIDNGSSDGTYEYVLSQSFQFSLRYIYEKQVGVVYARNRALKEVKGKLLAFIDDDCEASSDWIGELMKAHNKYPKAAAIQGKCLVCPPRGVISSVMQYLYDYGIQKYLYGKKIFTMDTANVLLSAESLKKNTISFRSSQYYGEDIDLCYQIWFHGQKVLYEPSIIVNSYRRFSKVALAKRQYDKGVGRAAIDTRWSVSFYNNFFVVNGTKHDIFPEEKKEHNTNFSQVKLQYPKLWQRVKGKMLLFLYAWLFKVGYFRHKQRSEKDPELFHFIPSHTVPLSVGIITRNRSEKLKRLLLSMQKQTVYPSEIVVIDNASSDSTKDTVLSFQNKLPMRYVQEKKVGIPYARNRVFQEVKEALLAFIDDDCEASPDWIENMYQAHKKYPDIAAIQGKTINKPEGAIKSQIVSLKNWYWITQNTYDKNHLTVLDTKNLLLNIKYIKRWNLRFDTKFSRSSDVEFGKQLLAHQTQIIYDETIIAFHYVRESLFAFLKRYYFVGKGKAFLESKWPEQPRNSLKLHLDNLQKLKDIQQSFSPLRKKLFILLYAASSWIFHLGYTRNRYSSHLLDIQLPSRSSVDFSVCIVTNDRATDLYRCLLSLFKQTYMPKEIIIVDSSINTDDTQNVINQFKKILPLRYFHEKPSGIGHARNTAMEHISGKFFAFIDDDCEAAPIWIEQMLKAHQQYPEAAAIQGKVFLVPFKGLLSKICQDEYDKWVKENLQRTKEFLSLDFENTSFKHSLIQKTKITCDTQYEKYYYDDDVDFGYQLLCHDKKIVYFPAAYVFAKRKKTLLGLLKQRWLQGRSRAVVDIKWDYVREKKAIFLQRKQFPLSFHTAHLLDNPFSINNDHYVSSFILQFYPFLQKLLFRTYMVGYAFQMFLFEHDFERIAHSVLPKVEYKKSQLSVSVMIITKDRKTLGKSLDSLTEQTRNPHEVIIVDSSKQPIHHDLEGYRKFFRIKYVYEQKLGFGIARNTAVKAATGDIIATLDDDAKADTYWIERIQQAHSIFSSVTAIQGRIISMPKNSIIALVEQLHIEKWFLRQLKGNNSFYAISTKNVSFKRKDFLIHKIGFAENKFYGMYGSEDVDMGYQLSNKKLSVLYEPSIQVYHWERATNKEYAQQQYRKGMASPLIERDWNEVIKKRKRYFPLPNFLESLLIILKNPATKKQIIRYFHFYLIYLMADFYYYLGKKKMKEILKHLTRQKTVPLTVVIPMSTPTMVHEQLFTLLHQSAHPQKIILLSRSTLEQYEKIFETYTPLLPLVPLIWPSDSHLHRLPTKLSGTIVAFLDGETIPSYYWVESIEKAHKKYSNTTIQGMSQITQQSNLYNIIMQFNRQTLIRNTMTGDRNLYWKWMRGELAKDFYTNIHDVYNFSVKRKEKKYIEQILTNIMDEGALYELLATQKFILSPGIKVYKTKGMNLRSLLHRALYYGRIYSLWSKRKQFFTHKIQVNPVRILFAFIYYCLKNRKVLFLPLLIPFFILYEVTFLYSFARNYKNRNLS